jgi:fatty-acyl-CoA synthase
VTSHYETNLDRVDANTQALSPVNFLQHTATIYPDNIAIIHGVAKTNYRQLLYRCRRLASALSKRGIVKGSTVSIVAPNIPAHLEAHFAVPMTGAVLNSINIRLDAKTIAYIFDHGESDLVLVDGEFAEVVKDAVQLSEAKPTIVDIDDVLGPPKVFVGELCYEDLISEGDECFIPAPITDEWQSLALNYTSGTTGKPKGVVYHHRGAYLNAIGNSFAWGMTSKPVYLWTLPMFHCNGWCFPWTITLLGGTHVCLREVVASDIIDSIEQHKVTHMCGAPIVLSMLASASVKDLTRIPDGLKIMTAGAPPPAAVIATIEGLGAQVTHTYGLTEVYGPCVYCAWHEEWNGLPLVERSALKARQGVPYPVVGGLDVLDPITMQPVPNDGKTIGEVMFSGNVVMKGYLKNRDATVESFVGGWFHSGDLAVKHADGYIEIKDRSKDIIISGGENISSIEVESALYKHPAVLAAAVVAKKDVKWGETPCAFVELKREVVQIPSADELIVFCRDHLAGFKLPKTIVFTDLPKTSTGKIQKFLLRQRAREI